MPNNQSNVVSRYHLYDPFNDVHYANSGQHPPDTEVPVTGFQWVLGDPPEGSTIWLPPMAQLEYTFASIYEAQKQSADKTVRKAVAEVSVIIDKYRQLNDVELIIDEINALPLPPEFDTLKAQLLSIAQSGD